MLEPTDPFRGLDGLGGRAFRTKSRPDVGGGRAGGRRVHRRVRTHGSGPGRPSGSGIARTGGGLVAGELPRGLLGPELALLTPIVEEATPPRVTVSATTTSKKEIAA